MSRQPRALFRCDASAQIGAGHVTRCLALAEALADAGWHIVFVVGSQTIATVPRLADSGVSIRTLGENELDVAALREQARDGADLLIVDHYERDVAFEAACRAFVRKIAVLDDATGRNHDCDVLIDAGAASAAIYDRHVPSTARVLTGPQYALMGKSFVAGRAAALARRDGRPVKNILVSCGATDPQNATALALDALADSALNAAVTVVLSSQAPHVDAISERLGKNQLLLLDVPNMAELMTKADMAIGAPGATAYERSVLGLPTILITVADNQRGIAKMMCDAGAALAAGELDGTVGQRLRGLIDQLMADSESRKRISQAASALVDGRGASRILLALLDSVVARDGTHVRLRRAEASDEDWLLELQRHPQTRRYFNNPAVPSAGEHHHWMERALANDFSLLLIVENDGARAGFIRLDRRADAGEMERSEISIAVDPTQYGRGIGEAALALARMLKPAAVFDATVLPDNLPSQVLFKRAGFIKLADNLYRATPGDNRA